MRLDESGWGGWGQCPEWESLPYISVVSCCNNAFLNILRLINLFLLRELWETYYLISIVLLFVNSGNVFKTVFRMIQPSSFSRVYFFDQWILQIFKNIYFLYKTRNEIVVESIFKTIRLIGLFHINQLRDTVGLIHILC